MESIKSGEHEKASGAAWADDKIPTKNDTGLAPADNSLTVLMVSAYLNDMWIPPTYKEALKRPDLWNEPIGLNVKHMLDKKVWHLVQKLDSTNIMQNKWVFNIKHNKNGAILKHKARLVAKRFTQIPGLDFFDTYTSVVCYESLRMTTTIAASKDWKLWAIDFVSAYLNSKMKEDV